MKFANPTFWVGDHKQDVKHLALEPMGRVENVVLTPISVECDLKMSPEQWKWLRKVCSQVVTVEMPKPIPGVKKGHEVTIGEFTGTLYHVRKPRRDSEARIYYIRQIPPNLR